MHPQSMVRANILIIKTINIFSAEISIFTAGKNLCILHGQVFVMMKGLTIRQSWGLVITKTRPCNTIEIFLVVKMKIFTGEKKMIFFLFLLKT